MCIQCHATLDKTQIKRSLDQALECPRYDHWNTTSLSHLIQVVLDGEWKEEALLLLRGYGEWCAEHEMFGRVPPHGLECLPDKATYDALLLNLSQQS